jgi:hypothetical protein
MATRLPPLLAPRSPVDLAVVRIVVFGLLAYLCIEESPAWMAGLPKDLLDPPPLTGWLTALPIEPVPVRVAQIVTILSALAAMVGLAYRVTAPLAVLGSLYVLGVPQLWGKVNHYHNVVWFAAILAASPADRALSPGHPNNSEPVSGRPLFFIAILIGLAYFWPGVAKARMGVRWIWSDNLKLLLYQKWAELPGFTPLLPIDRFPLALRLLALGTVLFELSFLWLILFRHLRPFAVLGGLVFHAGTATIMGINLPLWPCYVAFFRWGRVPATDPPGPGVAVQVIGWTFICAAVLAYPLRVNGWPIAYYPTFAGYARPTRDIVVAEGLDPAVERRVMQRMEESRWYVILRRAATDRDPATRARTLRGIQTLLAREAPGASFHLTVVRQSVIPLTSR